MPNGNQSLSKQYGGTHAHGWVERLPASWVPFVQLARLSPPAALFLIYFPHLFGLLHAARRLDLPTHDPHGPLAPGGPARTAVLLLGGSFFFSNAAHAWNDLIDAPIDRQVARSRNRPIPRGAISPRAAFLFTVSQALGAAAFLLVLRPETALATVPTIVGTTYYPFSKRHTYFPQVVLGCCLAWGIVVGSAAAGLERPWADASTLLLVAASVLWTVIYDTIYAYQDVKDDLRIGVKSIAVWVRTPGQAKALLWCLLLLMGAALVSYAKMEEMSGFFYIVAVSGSLLSMGRMVAYVDLRNEVSCWWWFSAGFWYVGLAITGGLLLEYML